MIRAADNESELRVLIVDDNVDGAEALGSLLSSMGCATAVAFTGSHALAIAAQFHPQLALIDLEMPEMNGCEVVRLLRAGNASGSCWIVCLTGHGQPEDRRLCIDAGFDAVYTKPMLPGSLTDLVAELRTAPH